MSTDIDDIATYTVFHCPECAYQMCSCCGDYLVECDADKCDYRACPLCVREHQKEKH